MIIKFKQKDKWYSLETAIPASKEILKTIVYNLNENKFSAYIDKQSKTRYYLKSKEKIAIEIIVLKNEGKVYVQLIFRNGIDSICVDNINDFSKALNIWYEEFIKCPIVKGKPYKRKGIYSIEEVLSKTIINGVKGNNDLVEFDNDMIHMSSDRYKTFLLKGTKCVTCGLEAKYFAKETFNNNCKTTRWHFNLYALDEKGNEVLMTKDHVIPRSKGGQDIIDNYQTMCSICNCKKGNNM